MSPQRPVERYGIWSPLRAAFALLLLPGMLVPAAAGAAPATAMKPKEIDAVVRKSMR